MIKENIQKQQGISLVTLSIAIIIMLIISSVLIFNANTGINTRNLNNMYNDIYLLKDKIDLYYVEYGKLPIIDTAYSNTEYIHSINVNDNNNYYVIDLEALENLSLNYGKDYKAYQSNQDVNLKDLYVLNEQSHHIYYIQGIKFDTKTYYTIPGEYTKVDIPVVNSNVPKITNGMTPIKWDGNNMITTQSYDPQWYNYLDSSVQANIEKSKWANAQTEDGSMWVWIPRYAYKITYVNDLDKSAGGNIDVVFLKDDTNLDFEGKDVTKSDYQNQKGEAGAYIVHPAFQNGQANHFINGEWDSKLTGFWVAKFEASREDATSNNIGTSQTVTIRPNVKSWTRINIGDSYTSSLNMLPQYKSHLIKNSEWGAIAYLTHSKYGINGQEVAINDNGDIVTGGGNYQNNINQSSTGNIYGIYDLNGGVWEATASYISNGNQNINSYANSFAYTVEDENAYLNKSTKYATIYSYDINGDSNVNNWTKYNSLKTSRYGYGDAMLETSTAGSGLTSWNKDYSSFPNTTDMFVMRGGYYDIGTSAGVFAFSGSSGEEASNGRL